MSLTASTLAAETIDVLGISDHFDLFFRRSSQTSLNSDPVSENVGRVLAGWNDRPITIAKEPAFPRQPAQAVDHIAFLLGIPNERVLAAVGVKPRTYFGWKTGKRRARPQSLGSLWPMTEAIHYMSHAHPNLAAWFGSEPEAQALFDAGKVDQLIQLELNWSRRSYATSKPINPDFGDSVFSPAGSDSESEMPRRRAQQLTTAEVVKLKRRSISNHE